jgi:hypothetical protein
MTAFRLQRFCRTFSTLLRSAHVRRGVGDGSQTAPLPFDHRGWQGNARLSDVAMGLFGHIWIVSEELFKGAHYPLPSQPGRWTIDFLSRKRTAPREAACECAGDYLRRASSCWGRHQSSLRGAFSPKCLAYRRRPRTLAAQRQGVRRPYLTGLDRKPILRLTLRDDPSILGASKTFNSIALRTNLNSRFSSPAHAVVGAGTQPAAPIRRPKRESA